MAITMRRMEEPSLANTRMINDIKLRGIYVYFLGNIHERLVKIGMSANLKNRARELQTGFPFKMEMIFAIKCNSIEQAYELEGTLHKRYARYNTYGEWFKLQDFFIFEARYIGNILNNIHITVSQVISDMSSNPTKGYNNIDILENFVAVDSYYNTSKVEKRKAIKENYLLKYAIAYTRHPIYSTQAASVLKSNIIKTINKISPTETRIPSDELYIGASFVSTELPHLIDTYFQYTTEKQEAGRPLKLVSRMLTETLEKLNLGDLPLVIPEQSAIQNA